MFQTIDEDVVVAGIYDHNHFMPKKFKWREHTLIIQEITLISDIREGEIRKRMYSITSGKNLYRLVFNRSTENWRLAEIWVE